MGLFSRLKRMCIRMAAEEGYAPAQTYIGVWYAKGDGVEQAQPVAAQWYRKAAEQGNAAAQFYLGISYRNGNGVEHDLFFSSRRRHTRLQGDWSSDVCSS